MIRKGEDWGSTEALPANGAIVSSDAEARNMVMDARRRRSSPPPLGLLGGDLCTTLGGRGSALNLHSEQATHVRVDLGSVLIDGRRDCFLAHMVIRRSWIRGPFVVVMNAEWLGSWRLAPRGHPGDGYLDVTQGWLPFVDRMKALSRLRTGSHLPHPNLQTSRVTAAQFDVPAGHRVWLDGVCVGTARSVSVRIEEEALDLYV